MPIYRCNQCGWICEEHQTAIHSQTACQQCEALCTVYGTVPFVDAIIKRLTTVTHALQRLQAETALSTSAAPAAHDNHSADQATAAPHPAATQAALQHWFAARKIDVHIDPKLSDTSGFFDDSALKLVENYALFGELIDRICFAYRKSHSTVTLELGQLAQKEVQAMTALCHWLYEHTFFARYHYQKAEKLARLTLQSAPAVRQFFEGGWLEWYALMAVQNMARRHHQAIQAYARGVKVVFPNEDLHELDVICLIDGNLPICIECKSGEFRRDIDKYLRLSKRLGIPRNRFLILSPDLKPEQAVGLSTMYELSFVNLDTLEAHLQTLL